MTTTVKGIDGFASLQGKHLGWSGYFLFCAAIAIPGLLLLLRWDRWHLEAPSA